MKYDVLFLFSINIWHISDISMFTHMSISFIQKDYKYEHLKRVGH